MENNEELLVIKRMSEENLEEVAELEKVCFTVPWSKLLLEESLKNQFDFNWVLFSDQTIAGYCNFRVIAGEGELMRIAVLPEFRGRGYSRRLMEILESDAREKQVEAITLEVRVSNLPAIHLYKSCGFKIEAVRNRYYREPVEDALIMWKRGMK